MVIKSYLLRRLGEGEARARKGSRERPAGRGWGDERNGFCGRHKKRHHEWVKETDAPIGKGM